MLGTLGLLLALLVLQSLAFQIFPCRYSYHNEKIGNVDLIKRIIRELPNIGKDSWHHPWIAKSKVFEDTFNFVKIKKCELVIDNMPTKPDIEHRSQSKAFYKWSNDWILIPKLDQFKTIPLYYKTLFHELAHSTGHQSRLNRNSLMRQQASKYKTFIYYKMVHEEIVCELASLVLCEKCGIRKKVFLNSIQYLKLHMSTYRDYERQIMECLPGAQESVDYILAKNKGLGT